MRTGTVLWQFSITTRTLKIWNYINSFNKSWIKICDWNSGQEPDPNSGPFKADQNSCLVQPVIHDYDRAEGSFKPDLSWIVLAYFVSLFGHRILVTWVPFERILSEIGLIKFRENEMCLFCVLFLDRLEQVLI